MDRPYVEWVRVENYRCIKQADLHLTPLHALIGPNDSGKSSLLRAIENGHATMWVPPNGVLSSGRVAAGRYPGHHLSLLFDAEATVAATEGRIVLRLDPDSMRQPVSLIARGETLSFSNEKGYGLPGLYDALLTRDIPAFVEIDRQFTALFPTVRALRMHNHSSSEKQIGLTLRDGTEVAPDEMSEGMLYWLAFAIIAHVSPPAMLLVEEPENGLHPARIAEVVRILRKISERTQIILATHSPLVINELKPDEVTIVTRTVEDGTKCTPMTETKNFELRSRTYALGELWLNYADGKLESALVPGNGDEHDHVE